MSGDAVKARESGKARPRVRAVRVDACRNMIAVLEAARDAFATSGVDAPMRDIAARAGVGTATISRHFPRRADLIAAVFRHEVDACAEAAAALAVEHPPAEALGCWMQRYAAYIRTKRGLATALHSGDPAYAALPGYFEERLVPALAGLLDAAVAAGEARPGVDPFQLLSAVGRLGMRAGADDGGEVTAMVALLVDGIRFGAKAEG